MFVEVDNPDVFVDQCKSLVLTADDYLFICLGRDSEPHLDKIRGLLSSAGLQYFGAIFPAVIQGTTVSESGAIVQVKRLAAPPSIARIDSRQISWVKPLAEVSRDVSNATCLILPDYSCVAVSSLIELLFNRHGDAVNYLGAGAGIGDRRPNPVIFCNDGRFTGAALVCYISGAADVSLRHGWSRASRPLIATRVTGNAIEELNWEPAMSIYTDLVGKHVAESLGRGEDVPDAKRFPFGMAREDLEDVVRDPLLSTARGALVVLSNVPQNSIMYVMQAKTERLIFAASQLAEDFEESQAHVNCLIFDCFSRAMLLGDDFKLELKAFETTFKSRLPNSTIEGVLALGEIASDGKRLPDFHNKTFAAGVFDARE